MPAHADSKHEVKQFVINISEEKLSDHRQRLRNTRWPDQIGSDWEYGTDIDVLKDLVEHWGTRYDWKAIERHLNHDFHHFTLCGAHGIDRLHFLHERWPGSFFEFYKMIPLLTNPGRDQPAFHIVAPSLPGFAFSSAPKTKGFGLRAMASLFNTLMHTLGYRKYFSQGGDWGAVISKALGVDHPASCRAIQLNSNMATPVWYNPLHILQYLNGAFLPQYPLLLSPTEIKSQQFVKEFLASGNGYYIIQATKPQSLGYAMHDSPTGLLAWIVEKFFAWSDNGGRLENSFSRDEVLTNASLYWLTGSVTSSFRIYYEASHTGDFNALLNSYCSVPTGFAAFAVDINAPESWARPRYNLKRYRTFPRGGHFSALEQPEVLAREIRAFFATCSLE